MEDSVDDLSDIGNNNPSNRSVLPPILDNYTKLEIERLWNKISEKYPWMSEWENKIENHIIGRK